MTYQTEPPDIGSPLAEGARLIGIHQPDLSRLLRGDFDDCSAGRLMKMLTVFEQDIEIGGTQRLSHRLSEPPAARLFAAARDGAVIPVAKPSPQRRGADNKSARWAARKSLRQQRQKPSEVSGLVSVTEKTKRISGVSRGRAISMPVLIGAAMIATAILLSTLITAVGTRFVGMESPSEESLWLIDRLTGSVYKCQASERGKAACDAEIATGSIGERPKH
jgi:hypothetical protein